MEMKTWDETLRASTNKQLGLSLDGRSLSQAPTITFDSDENLRTVVFGKGNNWMMNLILVTICAAWALAYASHSPLMWFGTVTLCLSAPFYAPRAWDANYKRVYVTNKRLIVTDWELRLTEFPFLHATARQAPLELLAVVSLDGNDGLLVIPRELGNDWTDERLAQAYGIPLDAEFKNRFATSALFKDKINRLRNPESVIHELDAIAASNPNRQMPIRKNK